MTENTRRFLPYGKQSISDEDVAAVAEVLRSDFLTTGPMVPKFEAAFAEATQAKHAIAVSSGTAALHLAALAAGLGPGKTAIVPAITFMATANAALYTGASVTFADVDPETGLLTAHTLREALGRAGGAAAILPVHYAGRCVDMAQVMSAAKAYGARVIEDACHAVGGIQANGRPVGAGPGHMAIFSLHPVKTIAAGEGGVITTRDDDLAQKLRVLRNHGMDRESALRPELATAPDGSRNPWYHEMVALGFNYRLSDIHAGLALSQLSRLKTFVSRRRALVDRYREKLAPLAPIVLPPTPVPDGVPAWHLCAARINFDAAGRSRASVMHALRDLGVGTQVHYIPVHMQPFYLQNQGSLSLPGAETFYARTLSLPLFP
ncbi:MAG: UDP-4-amino-4,6-dideoxy-N-acetyl-beta-L-altrosamine transaminase, partial [Magnetospiraceae bacterium]